MVHVTDALMRPPLIHQSSLAPLPRGENTPFSWAKIGDELGISSDGPINIAHLAVDRHANSGLADKTAFRFLAAHGSSRNLSYRELAKLTNRFGNALSALGIKKGDTVFVLCSRICELYVAALGALKIGAVVSPLFQSFGPEPIRNRIAQAAGKVLITTVSTYNRKVAALRPDLPSLTHVLVIDDGGNGIPADTLDLRRLMLAASDMPVHVATEREDPALLHFTSGTTGMPKGAIHVHGAALTHYASAQQALDLHPDDVFWCTADPGWVTGTSYGIIAPLLIGATCIVDEADFDVLRWIDILQKERVNVWYTAPTAIRLLMKAGPEPFSGRSFPDLRFIASVGEALNPEAVCWGLDVLGQPIHDNWWQSETGGIMIANTAWQDIKPGSMGQALPGISAHVVRHREGEPITVIEAPDTVGELALETGWPSMFRGYLNQPERYRACFSGNLYLTGDWVRRDAEGYYWFVGRGDEVIKSSGHLIGSCEVESVLMEHPAVVEAAVIGKPDALAGEVIQAFVTLKHGMEPSEDLRLELMAHARKRLGAAIAPKEIAFESTLPHTQSGKIMRRLLKDRALDLPEGANALPEKGR
jgi:acetyl-CoA synthetase